MGTIGQASSCSSGRADAAARASGARLAYFAFESTGHDGHTLQQYLLERGYAVIGINPAHTKKFKEVLDSSPEKSEVNDAPLSADGVRIS